MAEMGLEVGSLAGSLAAEEGVSVGGSLVAEEGLEIGSLVAGVGVGDAVEEDTERGGLAWVEAAEAEY